VLIIFLHSEHQYLFVSFRALSISLFVVVQFFDYHPVRNVHFLISIILVKTIFILFQSLLLFLCLYYIVHEIQLDSVRTLIPLNLIELNRKLSAVARKSVSVAIHKLIILIKNSHLFLFTISFLLLLP